MAERIDATFARVPRKGNKGQRGEKNEEETTKKKEEPWA